jgi:Protein of unknown function (DUF2000)
MAANVAAILCGQLGTIEAGFFGEQPVIDRDRRSHASVNQNVAILKANGAEQLVNTYDSLHDEIDLTKLLFSEHGQLTSNNVELYLACLSETETRSLVPVALIVAGDDDKVRKATKKFSLYS